MFEVPRDIEQRDLEQWLRGSWYVDATDGHLCRHGHVGFLDDESYVIGDDAITRKTRRTFARNVRIHWPRCGSVNILELGIAAHVSRLPLRVYNRSYSARQVEVYVPNRWAALAGKNEQQAVDIATISGEYPGLVTALFSPTYEPFSLVKQRLSDKTVSSVALGPSVIVAAGRTEWEVFYRGKQIGVVENDALAGTELTGPVLGVVNKLLSR